MTCRRTKFKNGVDELQKKKNKIKSSGRAKVEHVLSILQRVFDFDKVRYRGIAKNHNRLCANFALVPPTYIANGWPGWGRTASGDREIERQHAKN